MFEEAWQMLEKLDTDQQNILGFPGVEVMQDLISACIERNDSQKAMVSQSFFVESCSTTQTYN